MLFTYFSFQAVVVVATVAVVTSSHFHRHDGLSFVAVVAVLACHGRRLASRCDFLSSSLLSWPYLTITFVFGPTPGKSILFPFGASNIGLFAGGAGWPT